MTGRLCTHPGCLNPLYCKSFCSMHYQRWRKTGDPDGVKRPWHTVPTNATPDVLERILAKIKIDEATGCWLWTGARNASGYGIIAVNKSARLVHRVAYEVMVGPIPDDLCLDHVHDRGCRYRHCVNVFDHLEPVTPAENIGRGAALIDRCPAGHRYDEANTYLSGPHAYRQCRPCANERRRVLRHATNQRTAA